MKVGIGMSIRCLSHTQRGVRQPLYHCVECIARQGEELRQDLLSMVTEDQQMLEAFHATSIHLGQFLLVSLLNVDDP